MAEPTEFTAPVWTRMPRESARAHEAAGVYFEMRANRSLAAVSRKLGKSVSLIERWSKRWGWVDRAAAYDDHLAREEQNAIEKQATERAEEWRRRDEEGSERMYHIGQKILSKVETMLDFPLTSMTQADGKTVIRPARWTLKDTALLIAIVLKMSEATTNKEVGEESGLVPEEFVVEDYK